MASCYGSKKMKRSAKTIVLALLGTNIITTVTVISLVVTKATERTASFLDYNEVFKRSLDKKYHETALDLTVSSKKLERAVPSPEFLSLLKPVAHLSGLHFEHTLIENDKRVLSIRNWALSEGSERILMYNGLKYQNGSISLPAAGTYFVYSHIKFYVENNLKGSQQDVFYHGVFRYNAMNKTEEVLLANQVTECKEGINEGAHLEYTSDIRGLVRLNAGDCLTVKVSSFNLLKHDRDWHYFGLYLV